MAEGGTAEMTVLVKAAMHNARNPQEIVYAAGVTEQGEWVRVVPLSFRRQSDAVQFKRWDRIKFRFEPASDDARPETRRVIGNSIEIVGEMHYSERKALLDTLEEPGTAAAMEAGRSLVLINPRQPSFSVRKKTPQEIEQETRLMTQVMPIRTSVVSEEVARATKIFPFRFQYRHATAEGELEHTYQDWEMSDTFSSLASSFGDAQTMARAVQVFGKDYIHKGLRFVMSRDAGAREWVINGLICMEEVNPPVASNLNIVA